MLGEVPRRRGLPARAARRQAILDATGGTARDGEVYAAVLRSELRIAQDRDPPDAGLSGSDRHCVLLAGAPEAFQHLGVPAVAESDREQLEPVRARLEPARDRRRDAKHIPLP